MIMKRIVIVLFILCFAIFASKAGNTYKRVNIVYIGNSITAGAGISTAPPTLAVSKLENKAYCVRYANCGVSGSTTVDFLPETGTRFANVLKSGDSMDQCGVLLVFSIMLGTNDSAIKGANGSPVSPADYKKNLKTIIDALKKEFPDCKIVLNKPIWYSPNTYNNTQYLKEGLDRLQTYFPQIDALIQENPDYIFEGDTDGYVFFETNYLQYFLAEPGNSGTFYLHLNQDGADKLADFWVAGLEKHFNNWRVVPVQQQIPCFPKLNDIE